MFFDFSQIAVGDAYKLMASSVVPRPIAWITSRNGQGTINAAPYSFFNVIGSDPALVVVGISDAGQGKDTGHNIREQGEFVVNLVARVLAEAMNICAVDFPSQMSEVEMADLQTSPGQKVNIPRLTASPVSLECREYTTLEIGRNRLVVGQVLGIWIEDRFVDEKKFHVDSVGLNLIGRMGGAGGYTETQQPFEISRISYDQWRETQDRS